MTSKEASEFSKKEPLLALDGGNRGLKAYNDIAEMLSIENKLFRRNSIILLLEIGTSKKNFKNNVVRIFTAKGWNQTSEMKDGQGCIRCIGFEK